MARAPWPRGVAWMLACALAAAVSCSHAWGAAYAVGPGDLLQVRIRAGGDQQDEFAATVGPAGAIACPLVGEVFVAGHDVADIERRLAAALGSGWYVSPSVSVSVLEYAGRIRVLGEVRHPGVFPMSADLTLLAACDLAGGLTDYASARRVRLCRIEAGRPSFHTVDLVRVRQGKANDVVLRGGDRIEVPRRWF